MTETRTLIFLLKSSARIALPTSGVFLLSTLIFDKFGLDAKAFISGCWIMAVPAAIMLGVCLTSINFSWLISLPISRMRLICLQYVFQILNVTLLITLLALVTLLWNLYHYGLDQTQANITQLIEKTHSIVKANPPSNWHLTTWANIITFSTWFSLIPLLGLRRGKAGIRYHSSNYFRKTQFKTIAYALGATIFFAITRSWLNWGFVGYCAINSFAAYLGTHIAIHQLGLSPRGKGLRAGIGLGLASINILAILVISQIQLKSGDANKIADVISFTGPYTGNADPKKIAHALEADISDWNVEQLGKFYKNLLKEDNPLPPAGHLLTFQAAIQNKTALPALVKTAALFDLDHVTFEDMKQFLTTAERVAKDNDVAYLTYYFTKRSFSEPELRELLDSNSNLFQIMAIRWVRFHPSNQYLAMIEGRLDKYSDSNRLSALLTLSMGSEKELHLKDFEAARKPRLDVSYAPQFCTYKSAQDLNPTPNNTLQKLNFCLRTQALSKSGGIQQKIDSVGWYTEDKIKSRKDLLKYYLGLKE